MKQKLTLLFLCFAMVLTLCTFFTFGASAVGEIDTTVPDTADDWDGSFNSKGQWNGKTEDFTTFEGQKGDGQSAETAWQISTAEQLAYIGTLMKSDASFADDYFVLTADLNMVGQSFKVSVGHTNTFKGVFDGNGKTIYNLAGTFFASVGASGYETTIKNLNMVNATGNLITSANKAPLLIQDCDFHVNTNQQAFIIRAKTSAQFTMERVIMRGQIDFAGTTTNPNTVAAFVCYANSGCVPKFIDCVNYASVKGMQHAAAFLGGASVEASFENCFNYGDIESTSYSAAALVADKYNSTAVSIEGCANYGAIKGHTHAGGLVGLVTGNYTFPITNSANYGSVHAVTGDAGAIMPSTNGGVGTGYTLKMSNVIALGRVTAESGNAAQVAWKFNCNDKGFTNSDYRPEISNVYYLAGTNMYGSTNMSTDWIVNCGEYVDGLDGTYASLDPTVWLYAAMPEGTEQCPQLANAPHLKNAALPKYTVTFLGSDEAVLGTVTNVTEGSAARVPVVPEIEGYNFVGWTNTATGELVDNSIFNSVTADLTVKATYAIKTYTVNFYNFAGEVFNTQTVEHGSAATIPAFSEIVGYTFKGWKNDATEEFVTSLENVTSDLEIKAVYEIISYTVIFYDATGNKLSTQLIEHGSAALPPADPVEEGYDFTGWDKAFDNVTGNLDVYPTFTIKSFTVTFLDREGDVFKTESVEYGASATAPVLPPITGFVFVGWDEVFDEIKSDLTVKPIYSELSDLFAAGDGSEISPYVLSVKDHLKDLAAYINGTKTHEFITAEQFAAASYILANDIDLGGEKWTPFNNFTGHFNGNNMTIKNFSIGAGALMGFFKKATGVIENLSLYNVDMTGSTNNNRGMLVGEVGAGELLIDNCHVHGNLIGGNSVGGFVGLMQTQGGDLKVKNSSVSGSIKGKDFTGGIFGKRTKGSFYFENCTNYATVTASGSVGGIAGSTASSVSFIGCVNYGDITCTGDTHAGGILGGNSNFAYTIKLHNCINYGTVKNTFAEATKTSCTAGGIVGWASAMMDVQGCANYGTVSAVSGYAGGLFGASASGDGGVYDKVIGNLSLGTVKALEGKGGALVGYLGARSGKTHKVSYVYYVGTPIGTVDPEAPSVTFTNFVELSSVTAIDELDKTVFSSDLWTVGTLPTISGISVTLGNSISLNVYARVAIVLKSQATEGFYVNGTFVSAGEEATVGGALYTKYVFDSFELTDMDEALALSLIDGDITQKTYAITTYLANTYKNYADNANLAALVEAIALYGNAAQLADEQEPTVLSSFVAAAGIELPEDYSFEAYVAEKFRTVNLKTNNTSAAGMGINLSGTIDPIFYVADGITKVEVEIYGKTTTIEVVEGVAQFYGLNATSLNNTIQVTFYAGNEVVSTQRTSVACYIETALATEGFLSEGKAVLAQALAVYMRAARNYMGLN